MFTLLFYIIIILAIFSVTISIVSLVNKNKTSHSPSPSPSPSPPSPSTNPLIGLNFYVQKSLKDNIKNTINTFSLSGDDATKLNNLSTYPSALWIDTRFRIFKDTLNCGNFSGTCPDKCKPTGCLNKNITYNGGNSLEEALIEIKNSHKYNAILIIIYDLPNRDCHASASNGLICTNKPGGERPSPTPECLNDYKTKYIDNIYNLLNRDNYKDIKKVLIIEPDSFPNCITNSPYAPQPSTSNPPIFPYGDSGYCVMDICYKSYFPGIQYALQKFSADSNCYCYLDMAHNNWLGWDLSFNNGQSSALINLFNGIDSKYQNKGELIRAKSNSGDSDFYYDISSWPSMLYGFSLNVSNYNPLGTMCPFDEIKVTTDDNKTCKNYKGNVKKTCNYMQELKSYIHSGDAKIPTEFRQCLTDYCSSKANWNGITNLLNFSYILNLAFQNIKFKNSYGPGIIIDVSRNGDPISTLYPERGATIGGGTPSQCGSWCNQLNSTSILPQISPSSEHPFIHAYLWLKTPGESDGCIDPNNVPTNPPGGGKYGQYSSKVCKLRKSQQKSNGQTYCPRYDNMCGLTYLAGYNQVPDSPTQGWEIDSVTKLRGQYCPPSAGQWDDLQILQLAGVSNLEESQIPPEYPNANL